MESPAQNLISIIIPAFNSGKTILKTIDAVLKQTYSGPKEVIIVDDGSSDDTKSVVNGFKEIKYVYQKNAGPANARNKGFYNSIGKIVFFTDADCIPRPDWINTALVQFDNPKTDVVSGSYGIANSLNLLAKCIYDEIIFRHKRIPQSATKVFGSYNFAIRRDVFESVQGFDESYKTASGEDNDLSYRIRAAGHQIQFVPDMRVDHFHPERVGKYLREQFNHGLWRVKIYLDHPRMAQGDDYTYWKDIMETGFAGAFFASLFASFFGFLNSGFLITLLLMLLFFEFFYGIRITKSIPLGAYFGYIMFLRAWSRACGFLFGLVVFLPKKISS